MDLDAPADAWYVFIGVSILSFAVAGVVLGLPTGQGPDANGAIEQIDNVAGSTYETDAQVEHNAERFWVDSKRIGLKNSHGTATESVSFGTMAPVYNESGNLSSVLTGTEAETAYSNNKTAFEADIRRSRNKSFASGEPQWHEATGTLRIRKVIWGDFSVTIVDF